MNAQNGLVSKLWNYCNVLRDDGLSYGDYLEQLTYLLFLKMAHEQTQPPWKRESIIPADYDWRSLLERAVMLSKSTTATSLKNSANAAECWAWCSARHRTRSKT